MKVAHFITRLIVGGAQENTLLNVEDQRRLHGDDACLITGPGLGPEGSLEQRARDNGVPLHLIPQLRRNIHPWRDWTSFRELLRLLRELRPALLHTHSSKAGIMGRAAAERLGIPVVHTVHGAAFHYGQSRLAHAMYREAERWAGKRTDHFICVCDAMTEQYVQAGVAPREKFTTIYSGMEVEPFLAPQTPPRQVREELGIRPDEIVVGKIARMFDLKGHPWLLAAAKLVLPRYPRLKFLLVGDGIHRAKYEQELRDAGLLERFVFTGLVPPGEVARYIHAMDIVAHTSEWEGLARVLPQGLIAGKPVISYDVDGAREVVIPNETGCLLPPRSVEPLAAAIGELVESPELRRRLGQTGRDRFTDQFRHETMTRRIREVYRMVLDRRG